MDRPQGLDNEGLDGTFAPPDVDLNVPSIARVYDYVLGGKEHFEIDRRVAAALFAAVPEMRELGRESRNLLRRAVRYLVGEAGITQILDLGSGLPTEGNVHEIAHAINPDVHVVYIDMDPLVLAHGRALLANDSTTTVITADVRNPEQIIDSPAVRELIDPDRPFAVIAAGLFHHLADDQDPYGLADRIKARLSPGSYFVTTNFLDDDEPRAKQLQAAFEGGLGTGRFRTWDEQQRFFDGLEMVEPGLVYANDWRPDAQTPTDSPIHTLYAGGIGRKA